MSLKSQIESTISDAIQEVAGYGSVTVDTDLPVEDRIISNDYGAFPTDAEYTDGPLVRVMITDHATSAEEFGDLSNRVSTMTFGITVAGITRMCTDPGESGRIGSDTEEIIRLHLQHLAFNIETAYGGGRNAYATELQYKGTSFDTSTVQGRQTAPVVEAPVAGVGNSGNGTLILDADQAFSGRDPVSVTVEVVASNTAPTSNSGLTIKYKIGSGSWSSPIPVGTRPVPLAYNIWVSMTPTGILVPGDSWTIQARTSELYSIGMWVQSWLMMSESTAVF